MESIYNEDQIIKTLIKLIYLIDSKDEYTKKHSENVARYAVLLGRELKLEENDLKIIQTGAMLHDVGKIGVPDDILVKPNSLTEKEYEIIKRHVTIGEALLPIEGYEEIRKMIRSHHERLDGKGYPDHLKGSEIPYFARMLSIVDTFDAMTTQRAYNNVKTLEEAFKELLENSRKKLNYNEEVVQQLDPYLVKSFIRTIKNNTVLMEEFKKRDLDIIRNRSKSDYKRKRYN